VEIAEPHACLAKRPLEHRHDYLEMTPRGELGNHAAVGGVHVVLRGDHARQHATSVGEHCGRRLVTRALDPEHHHRTAPPEFSTRRKKHERRWKPSHRLSRLVRYRVVVCVAAGAWACGWPPSGRCCSINRIVLMTSSARCSCTSFLRSSIGSGDGSGRSLAGASLGASTTMSGVMPLPWIERPFGVKYFAVVRRRPEPSDSGMIVCTEPLPKVCVPTTIARPQSCSAPATISDAEALPWFTSTTVGIFV